MRSICKLLPVMFLVFGCATEPDTAPPELDTSARSTSGGGNPNVCARVSSANNGVYCGGSTQNGFGGLPSISHSLFTCVNSNVVDGTTCQSSCTIAPAGVQDHCNPDPCAGVSSANNGAYCGKSTQSGFHNQNASFFVVYTCTNGHTTSAQFCNNTTGCTVAPPGSPDHC